MRMVFSGLAGLLFGLGLVISGMSNPAKVQNFLDVAGTWDPSLAFVMAGAIAVTAPGFRLLSRQTAPLFSDLFHWPNRRDVDVRLISGAAIFGVGWGLSGYCPGPALTALPHWDLGTVTFVVAMLVGIKLAIGQDRPATA